ncbi:hypothetical protein [Streptomyces sp. NPDC014685]|uniref:hypothetical protein n=1 Tax=Streptomyces sp. NPDC014685 TaxID=3364881 RepID=UPI003702E915
MSGPGPVDPVGIPVFTGDLALLDTQVTALSGHGARIAEAAGDVHRSFGGLRAFYKAPEAEQLFATTGPVAAKGRSLSEDLGVIAGALGTYSDDAFPLVERLKELKRDAVAFRVKVDGDDTWSEDGDLVEENRRRRGEIAEVWTAFQEVERACHARIVALVGGTPLKTGDGSGRPGTYGYDAEVLKQAKSLPWGEAVEESTPWWQVWEHAYDFGKGFLVDGVWGTLKGLGTLAGLDGGDAAKEAWTGLAKLATGLSPAAQLALRALPGDHSAWLRDSGTAVKETGKALIAWDQWGSNPSRAAGAVTFNVLTTVFTGGTGGAASGAGKAGLAAKALSLTSKTARAVDPMTYLFKGAGAGLTRIGDALAGLKGLGTVEFPPLPDHVITVPEGTLRLPDNTLRLPEGTTTVPEGATTFPDGTVRLPEGAVALPEGTIRLPTGPGEPIRYFDNEHNLLDENGSVLQKAEDVRREGSLADRPHAQTPDPIREPALTGAAVRAADYPTHLGNDHGGLGRTGTDTPGGGTGDHLPDSDLDHTPGGGIGDNTPRNHLGDGVRSSRTDENFPSDGLAEASGTKISSNRDLLDGPATQHASGSDGPRSGGSGKSDFPGHTGDEVTHPEKSAGSDNENVGSDSANDHPEAAAGSGKPENGNPYAGQEPDYSRPALLPSDGPLTLRNVRNTRDLETRWKRGEELHRQMWGSDGERHYPVPKSSGPRYPVTAGGGRKVDAPVDLPGGRTVAIEVKSYGPYRTVTMKDGSQYRVQNEVPLSKGIKEQINKDMALRRMNPGYDPRWAFTDAGPSSSLRAYFKEAKIIFIEYGPAPKRDQWDKVMRKK